MNNLGGNYALGLTYPPPLLSDLGVHDPYPSELQPYAQMLETAAGTRRYVGRPIAKWKWGLLDQSEYNQLLAYAPAGRAVPVFIRTRVHSGVAPAYHTFSAMMAWPSAGTFQAGGFWKDVEIVFTNLVNANGE